MTKHVFAPLAVALSLIPSLALAHASLTPSTAANGATVKLAIAIPHGCDGAPTDTVVVKLPEGFVSARPQVKPGWQIEITKGDYQKSHEVHGKPVTAGALEIKWSGGSVPDDQFDEFVVQGTLEGFDADASLPFVITQSCGAATIVWDQIAKPGENAHALEHPAPSLAVTAAAADDPHAGMDMSMAAPASVTVGPLTLSGAFTRATLPNAPVGGGYVTIANAGSEADRLVSASSPVAEMVQLHQMKMEGEVMKMNEVEGGIEIPAGGTVTLAPGGLHIMFMGLKERFVEGGKVPVTLTFEKAGEVTIELDVGGIAAGAPATDAHQQHSELTLTLPGSEA